MRKTRKSKQTPAKLAKASLQPEKAPLLEHFHELKRRLFYVAVCVGVGSAAAYGVEQHLIDVLLRPSHGQHFVYTSPMGGVNFLFSVCIYVGIALSLPVIVFNILKFVAPLMRDTTERFIYLCSVASGLVAISGILFGYFMGLPAALHFLLHQFHNSQVSALISIQSYFSFVTAYMVGAAIMFQLPLLLIIINRITPLKPSQMFKYERMVIIFAFIAAFIMNPTPNVIDQLLVVVPIVIMYQMGIGLVWLINRSDKRVKYNHLFQQDLQVQAERLKQSQAAKPLHEELSAQNILRQFMPEPQLIPVAVENPVPPIEDTATALVQPAAATRRSYTRSYIPTSRSVYATASVRNQSNNL